MVADTDKDIDIGHRYRYRLDTDIDDIDIADRYTKAFGLQDHTISSL